MAVKLVPESSAQPATEAAEQQVSAFLDWITQPGSEDPAADLGPLREHLDALAGRDVDSDQRGRVLDLAQTRAQKIAADIKPKLREAGVPVPQALRAVASDLSEVFRALTAGHQRCAGAGEQVSGVRRRSPVVAAAKALKCLAERCQLAALVGASVPDGLWLETHRLYREARREFGPAEAMIEQSLDVDRVYREMLAFAAAQPPKLSAREAMLTADYVARFAAAVEITNKAPAEPDLRRFWLDPNRDMAPIPVARKAPPRRDDLIFLSCARLGLLAAEQVRELEAGTPVDNLHLPPDACDPAYRGLLQRLHDSWVEPPTRRLVRRRHTFQVDVCIGFPAVLRLFGQQADAEPADAPVYSMWFALNESPAGFAIVHVKGAIAGLETGGALALRSGDEKPWDLCVVRWLRTETPEQIEVGVQVISSGARPVRVAFRNVKNAQPPVPGLLVPAIPAIRAHEAILVPAGTCSSRRFLLVREEDRTHIVQGRMVNLDLQTASLELFEFQPDPYPI